MSINYGMPTFWWGQPGVVSIGYAWYDKNSPGLGDFKNMILQGGSGDETTRVAELDLVYLSCQGDLIEKLIRDHDFEKWDSIPGSMVRLSQNPNNFFMVPQARFA